MVHHEYEDDPYVTSRWSLVTSAVGSPVATIVTMAVNTSIMVQKMGWSAAAIESQGSEVREAVGLC